MNAGKRASIRLACVVALALSGVAVGRTGAQGPRGALDVRVHPEGTSLRPPAELLLTNPAGRRTGKDPQTASQFREIPNSAYESESIDDDETGAPGPETRIIEILEAPAGIYQLQVLGIDSGRYSLEIRGYDSEMANSDEKFVGVAIGPSVEHRYEIRYSPKPGSKIQVTWKASP